jgi:hypothetical protein
MHVSEKSTISKILSVEMLKAYLEHSNLAYKLSCIMDQYDWKSNMTDKFFFESLSYWISTDLRNSLWDT